MLAISDMPAVPGFTTPQDLYCAIAPPAPLFGMPYPLKRTTADWQALYAAGVRGVVCLDAPARYDSAPLDLLAVIELEDMVHGGPPIDPARELARVDEAVRLVIDRLDRGLGMVVHCVGGRGRTGAVIGSVLVRRGHDPDAVIAWLDALHRARGRSGWPESPFHETVLRAARNRGATPA